MRTGEGVWPGRRTCNGREERERQRSSGGEREKTEEMNLVGSTTVKSGTQKKLSPDLNPAWIQKQLKG
jgi:hypothetical protein